MYSNCIVPLGKTSLFQVLIVKTHNKNTTSSEHTEQKEFPATQFITFYTKIHTSLVLSFHPRLNGALRFPRLISLLAAVYPPHILESSSPLFSL